jgi:hypothetical protein
MIATYVALEIAVISSSVSYSSQISSLWSEGLRQISLKFKRRNLKLLPYGQWVFDKSL